MADANTPNHSFTLPEVGASRDTWGNKINANWTNLDTILDTGNGGLFVAKTGGTMTGQLSLIDATAAAHAMNRRASDARYLQLSGGTLSGSLTFGSDTDGLRVQNNGASGALMALFGSGVISMRFGGTAAGDQRFTFDDSGNFFAQGRLQVGNNGSSALPALAFTGVSANTGIYANSTPEILFTLNGTIAARIAGGNDTALPFTQTIVTRTRGDARYVRSDTNQTMTGRLTLDNDTQGIWLTNGSGSAARMVMSFSDTSPGSDFTLNYANTGTGDIRLTQSGTITLAGSLTIGQAGELAIDGNFTLARNITFTGSNGPQFLYGALAACSFVRDGITVAQVRDMGDISTATTIITREKGDARYSRISSDARKKTNIQDMPPVLSGIMQARPVSFEWLPDPADPSRPGTMYGLLAQEVQTIFPAAVLGSDEQGYGLDALTLVSVLIKAVQELHTEVSDMKAG